MTASVIVRFQKDQPPASLKGTIPFSMAPELRPDFVGPRHPSKTRAKMQMVGYQEEDISMDQVCVLEQHIISPIQYIRIY